MLYRKIKTYSEPVDSNRPISDLDEKYLILRTLMEGPDTGRRYGTDFGALYEMQSLIDDKSFMLSNDQYENVSECYKNILDNYFKIIDILDDVREDSSDTLGEKRYYIKNQRKNLLD